MDTNRQNLKLIVVRCISSEYLSEINPNDKQC